MAQNSGDSTMFIDWVQGFRNEVYCNSMERNHLVICNYPIHKCRQEPRGGKRQTRLDAKLSKLFDRRLRRQGGAEAGDHDGPIVFIAFLDISLGMCPPEVVMQVGN